MNNEEMIFTSLLFLGATLYIYKSLFKNKACGGSCGCSSSSKKKKTS